MYEELVKKLREQADYYCCHMGINSPPAMMFIEAADAIEDLSKTLDEEVEINTALECNMPVWIPVTERLPEYCRNVIVTDGEYVSMGWLDNYRDRNGTVYIIWYAPNSSVNESHISHWMPLPKPPDQTFGNNSDNCQKSKDGE